MCGIIGYIGNHQTKDILIEGLERLEYRGYDSAGVAIYENDKINIAKVNGRISDLKTCTDKLTLGGNVGIGHTRWATHGEPSAENSHPHFNKDKTIAIVHNGIIENYEELKKELVSVGYEFVSQTDTEAVVHLIDYYYNGDIFGAVVKTVKRLKGSFALGIISTYEPDKIIAVRKDSPLIIGLGDVENYIASDTSAILPYTRDVYFINDMEFAIVTKDDVKIYDAEKNPLAHKVHTISYDAESAEKGIYEHFMLKEIHEQAIAVKNTLQGRLEKGMDVKFDKLNCSDLKDIKKIFIVACGTAYHAGVIGKYVIEKLSGIPIETELASEFRYKNPILDKNTLVVVISQSGETADTLAALRLAKKEGVKTIAVTNVVGSSMSREADYVVYTYAGPEISVASTKAYTTQLAVMYTFALFLAEVTKSTVKCDIDAIKNELSNLPEKIERTFDLKGQIKKLAQKICNEESVFYLGRGLDYATSMEGSLKLKEISYIHSESYAGGELKHGPIAMIEKGTKVIAISTNKELSGKMDSNIKEVKSRGAYVMGIVPKEFSESTDSFDDIICIPSTNEILYPVLSAIPLQLLAYYVAVEKGYDVDKPRNLAKSVTVE